MTRDESGKGNGVMLRFHKPHAEIEMQTARKLFRIVISVMYVKNSTFPSGVINVMKLDGLGSSRPLSSRWDNSDISA